MINQGQEACCTEKLDKFEEQVLMLEIENHRLQQKISAYEFDHYKLQEIQRLAKAGSWELNHLTYDLHISTELSQVLYGKTDIENPISWHEFLTWLQSTEQNNIEKQLFENVIQNGESLVLEHPLIKPDGGIIFVRHHLKTFYNSINQPLITLGLIMDISREHSQALELEMFASTDELTQLYNRHRINEIMQVRYDVYQRHQESCTFIMFDIDFFKHFNDKFGHQIGDKVLSSVAKTVKNNIRKIDYAGRWGGEEFLIICQKTRLQDAAVLAEKLRKAIMKISLPNIDAITASFGVAEILPGETLNNLIKRADDALYEAKVNGRNQVKVS